MRVAVAQPRVHLGDIAAAVAEHVVAVRTAAARLVVFPELSLTGYDLDTPPVAVAELAPLVAACAETGTVALVGAPVKGEYIATLRVDADGVAIVYRKVHLGGDEAGRFVPGPGPAVIDVDGWRVGLGICRDTGVAEHIAVMAALHLDLYAAGLVHRPDELDEQRARARRIAAAAGAPVAFASCAGPAGPAYPATAGHSGLWTADGATLAEGGPDTGIVVAEDIAFPRCRGPMAEAFEIDEAQRRLLEILDRAASGESFVIERAGRPVARLLPIEPTEGSTG